MGLITPRTGPFHRIGTRYKTMFDGNHFLGQNALEESWMALPPTNIKRKESNVILEFAMPGFSREDIIVELKDNALHISALKDSEGDVEYLQKELPTNVKTQIINLSEKVDQKAISAKLRKGVLRVKLPETNTPSQCTEIITVG